MTYRGLVDWLVEHEVLAADGVSKAVQGVEWLDLDERVEPDELADVLDWMGLAVSVHGDDVDNLESSYRSILERAAQLSGGTVVITDVMFDADGPSETRLKFRFNGEPRSWDENHLSPEYLDQLAVFEQIGTLVPGGEDRRYFYGQVTGEPREPNETAYYFLLTAEQAAAFADEFGWELDAM
jgi:hypothetical protein